MSTIAELDAFEILDSRGNPTVKVVLTLENGIRASAAVPSGASTGEHEAHELRDGDPHRYNGKGVLTAVENVRRIIAPAIKRLNPARQQDIDRTMIELDGTPSKSKLGANAILGVSMAVSRAAAQDAGTPLYRHLRQAERYRLPVPMMNVINGGTHADNSIDFQEFMLVPHGPASFAESLRYGAETFAALKKILTKLGHVTSVGDEGGFAPRLRDNEEACNLILEAIHAAGFSSGSDIALALDPAASAFHTSSGYVLAKSGGGAKSPEELLQLYAAWVEAFPIVSIEDGFDENDWASFRNLTALLGERIQIVGDDLYVTNTQYIRRGISERASNAVLIKLNQIGTVTETIEAIEMCKSASWNFVISHRSGETEDTFIADFAVAMGGAQIKTGSLCRSERVAKYNRLVEIESELGPAAEFASPFFAQTGPA